MAGDTTVTQRLGRTIYWIGTSPGLLFAALALRITTLTTADGRGFVWPDVLIVATAFLIPFLIGRAARYVLAGERVLRRSPRQGPL